MRRRFVSAVALVLLCASAAQAARFGASEVLDDGTFGRDLLQRTLDCSKVNSGCDTCRNQRKPGSRTSELVCSTCKAGYRLRRDGISKTCDCAPGFFLSAGVCTACTAGAYCPGWDKTINPNNGALNCSSGLATTFQGAKSVAQCFTVAGYGRASVRAANGQVTFTATICDQGYYNVGGNTAGCQKCPAGLTTAGNGSTSPLDCVAPAGSYMDKGIGKICPKGTYSIALNNATSCTACPPGITTPTEGSTTADACSLAMRGYYLVDNTTAALCPVNTYNDGETLTLGQSCTACPNGLRTKLEGSDGEALCLAPPGYELQSGASVISECANGWFKVDWNRNLCLFCGNGLVTASTGSVTKDACLVPAGSGLIQTGSVMAAAHCTNNTYGVNTDRPASVASRCVSCPPNTNTLDVLNGSTTATGYTDQTDCKVPAGYGLTASGLAEICPKGTYNAGNNREACTPCAAGYTTVAEGKVNVSQCVVQPGWEMRSDGQVHPCDVGSWSPGGTEAAPNVTCTLCSVSKGPGFWTQTDESVSVDDCQVCAPGYGGTNCTECPYNTFSFGGGKEGDACTACATGSVSARGAIEAAMCYSEFIDPEKDVFSVNETAWSAPTGDVTVAGCQAACSASADACITYRWDPSAHVCELLLEDAAGTAQLGFKISNGVDNVIYKIDNSLVFGVPVGSDSHVADLNACVAACKANNDCEAFVYSAGVCGLRASELDGTYTGMVHVIGSHLKYDIDSHTP